MIDKYEHEKWAEVGEEEVAKFCDSKKLRTASLCFIILKTQTPLKTH
jgi:hypothetical protein